jgi:hypothetical protein
VFVDLWADAWNSTPFPSSSEAENLIKTAALPGSYLHLPGWSHEQHTKVGETLNPNP